MCCSPRISVKRASTISQQLAKNVFLSAERTPWRKGQEAILTVMIERVLDKRRILEIYLNVIEWGDGVFGAEAAARHYYGSSAAAIGPEQAARLAAMVPNPRYYDRNRSTAWLDRKTRMILVRMNAAGEKLSATRVANEPVALAAAVAEAGPEPEVVVEATYGWVRHEALHDRVGCKDPPVACRSRPLKLEAA